MKNTHEAAWPATQQPVPTKRARRMVWTATIAILIVLTVIGVYLTFFMKKGAGQAAVALPDTNYSIPKGAVFLAPNGNDTASGAMGAPVKTLAKAVAKIPSGGTIVLRGGSYYNVSLSTVHKKINIQPFPHEKVWIKGSKLVNSWKKDGQTWRHDGWTTRFCRTCVNKQAVNSKYPLAGWPDQVFINGKLLTEVKSKSQVNGGKFFVDYNKKAIYVGSDPTKSTVEASAQWRAFMLGSGAEGSVIKGVGFAQYAPHWNEDQLGMVISDAANVTFENAAFVQSAGNALGIYKPNNKLLSSVVSGNGYRGVGTNRADGLVIKDSTFDNNNLSHFEHEGCGMYCTVAGVKVAHTKGITVTNNYFRNNLGAGFWCDLGCEGGKITRNTVTGNEGNGIFYEVSTKGIIASNVIANNGRGLKIAGSDYLKIYNNTFSKNGINIGMYDDSRSSSTDGYSKSKKYSWNTTHVELRNNIVSDNKGSATMMYDTNTGQVNSRQMISAMDHNAWHRTKGSTPGTLIKWCASACKNYKTLGSFAKATGLEKTSLAFDNVGDPFFSNVTGGDFTLRGSSKAKRAGVALPADVASAVGVGRSPVDMGALVWRGKGSGGNILVPTPNSGIVTKPSPTPKPPEKQTPAPNNDKGGSSTPSAPQKEVSLTFAPTDDATIEQAHPDARYGVTSGLEADDSPRQDFLLKFSVHGLNGRTVKSAKLKLYATNSGAGGLQVFKAKHNNWNERTVRWNWAPWIYRPAVGTLNSVRKGQTYAVDLTSLVKADGTYSLRGILDHSDGVGFSSRQGAVKPQLVVTVR